VSLSWNTLAGYWEEDFWAIQVYRWTGSNWTIYREYIDRVPVDVEPEVPYELRAVAAPPYYCAQYWIWVPPGRWGQRGVVCNYI
jgi:hypothetical protein